MFYCIPWNQDKGEGLFSATLDTDNTLILSPLVFFVCLFVCLFLLFFFFSCEEHSAISDELPKVKAVQSLSK